MRRLSQLVLEAGPARRWVSAKPRFSGRCISLRTEVVRGGGDGLRQVNETLLLVCQMTVLGSRLARVTWKNFNRRLTCHKGSDRSVHAR